MKTISLLLAIACLPQIAAAEPARRAWGVRALALHSESLSVGGGADVRISRGRSAIHLGGTVVTGGISGHIRVEGTFNYDIGAVFLGTGIGVGTYSLEMPSANDDKWTGAAAALHLQLARKLAIGERRLLVEVRGGHSFPFGSTDPREPVPAGLLELTLGVGFEL